MHRTAVLALFITAACDNVEELGRLDHAQILAVRSEPAQIAPAGRARIDLLAGDDAGAVFEARPERVTAVGPGGPLAVDQAADGWYVTAGPAPELATVTVTLTIDGSAWTAEKHLVVGAAAANPRITAIQVDGAARDPLVVTAGTRPALEGAGEGMEPLRYAWYSSVGDLEGERRPTTILDAAEAAQGTVVLVLRDGEGGVDWQAVPATVE